MSTWSALAAGLLACVLFEILRRETGALLGRLAPPRAGAPQRRGAWTPLLLGLVIVALALCGAGCALPPGQPATPQRPTFCFGPTTTAEGTWELEAGLAVDPGDYHELPTTWKYGLGSHTEVSITASPLVDADHTSGHGDAGFGWRHRFLDADGAAPAVAVLASVKLPTADDRRGLGSGEPDVYAGLTAGGAVGRFSWTAFAELGVLGTDGEQADLTRDLALLGAWSFDATHAAFAELSDRRVHETGTRVGQLRVGHAISVRPDLVLDGSVQLPTSDDAPDTTFAIGFTRNLGGRPARRSRGP